MAKAKASIEAYIAGWDTCFAGKDGRFTNPHPGQSAEAYAWDHGFLDAMESPDGETPDPACAGYAS